MTPLILILSHTHRYLYGLYSVIRIKIISSTLTLYAVSAVKRAFEKASQQTSDVDEIAEIVKKEVGEEAFKEAEMDKRFTLSFSW